MSSPVKKYELVGTTFIMNGNQLRRIKYLINIPRFHVRAGDLGGFLESEHNLSHEGDCVVLESASVYGNARVYGDACVRDSSTVSGNARVYGSTSIVGHSRVYGNAKTSGHWVVDGVIDYNMDVMDSPLWKILYGK